MELIQRLFAIMRMAIIRFNRLLRRNADAIPIAAGEPEGAAGDLPEAWAARIQSTPGVVWFNYSAEQNRPHPHPPGAPPYRGKNAPAPRVFDPVRRLWVIKPRKAPLARSAFTPADAPAKAAAANTTANDAAMDNAALVDAPMPRARMGDSFIADAPAAGARGSAGPNPGTPPKGTRKPVPRNVLREPHTAPRPAGTIQYRDPGPSPGPIPYPKTFTGNDPEIRSGRNPGEPSEAFPKTYPNTYPEPSPGAYLEAFPWSRPAAAETGAPNAGPLPPGPWPELEAFAPHPEPTVQWRSHADNDRLLRLKSEQQGSLWSVWRF